MITYTILLFGMVREMAGDNRCTIELPANSVVSDLRKTLEAQLPALKTMKAYAISVNASYALDDDILPEHAEIAVIPPVSGG
jgi:molybdopterin converting factor small subunit